MKYTAIGENHLYQKVYRKGSKYVAKHIVVYVLPDLHSRKYRRMNPNNQTINRIGLTVTKKIGGAVKRSRVKRIIREGYRSVDRSRHVRCGFLIVIAARTSALYAKSTDIAKDMETALERLGMLE
ncbi:MAG: ribonuclease P protein component [Clostridia bacterium]|nr:ribonuclease P protein component [Clostridia bacterium]